MSLGTLFCPPHGDQDMNIFGDRHSSYYVRKEHCVNNEGTQDIRALRIWARYSGNSEVCSVLTMAENPPRSVTHWSYMRYRLRGTMLSAGNEDTSLPRK